MTCPCSTRRSASRRSPRWRAATHSSWRSYASRYDMRPRSTSRPSTAAAGALSAPLSAIDDMDRLPTRGRGRLHDRLAERRMRMHRQLQVLQHRAHLDGQSALADEVGSAVADHVQAEDLLALRVGDDL